MKTIQIILHPNGNLEVQSNDPQMPPIEMIGILEFAKNTIYTAVHQQAQREAEQVKKSPIILLPKEPIIE